MIKLIFVLIFINLFFSCASKDKIHSIKEDKYDGLKYESLKRYGIKRLLSPQNLEKPLAQCHNSKYNVALEEFKNNLDKNINNFQYWNQISTCYILKQEYPKAKHFLDIGLSVSKNKRQRSIIMNNLAVIQLENENYVEAKSLLLKAIKLNKKALTPKFNLSQIYSKYGLYNKSEKILIELLAKEDKDIDFLNLMAHTKLMKNDYKLALLYFNKIPKEYRSRDDIATNMAMTYLKLEKYEEANKTLDKADKKNSDYLDSQLEISKFIEKLNKSGK